MEDFIKVIKKDPKKQKKINSMLDRYMSLPYDFQSKIGYNSLIQSVILKESINLMSLLKIDFEKQLLWLCNLFYINDHYICNTK